MNHFELIEYAKSMGLKVDTHRCRDEMRRQEVSYIVFYHEVGYCPRYGAKRDKIASLRYHCDMEPMEYQDGCAVAYNSLKQFESWR